MNRFYVPGSIKCEIKCYDAGLFRRKLRYYLEISAAWNTGGRQVIGEVKNMHKNDLPRVAKLIEDGLNTMKAMTDAEQAEAVQVLSKLSPA